jgi:hypothetical protein
VLKIIDLSRNEELSVSDMGKVAGGECNNGLYSSAASTLGNFFSFIGCGDAAQTLFDTADKVRSDPYCL